MVESCRDEEYAIYKRRELNDNKMVRNMPFHVPFEGKKSIRNTIYTITITQTEPGCLDIVVVEGLSEYKRTVYLPDLKQCMGEESFLGLICEAGSSTSKTDESGDGSFDTLLRHVTLSNSEQDRRKLHIVLEKARVRRVFKARQGSPKTVEGDKSMPPVKNDEADHKTVVEAKDEEEAPQKDVNIMVRAPAIGVLKLPPGLFLGLLRWGVQRPHALKYVAAASGDP